MAKGIWGKQHRDLTLVDWSSTAGVSSLSCKVGETFLITTEHYRTSISARECNWSTSISKSFLVIMPTTRAARGTTSICLNPNCRNRLYTWIIIVIIIIIAIMSYYRTIWTCFTLLIKQWPRIFTFVNDISSGTTYGEGFRNGARSMYISRSSGVRWMSSIVNPLLDTGLTNSVRLCLQHGKPTNHQPFPWSEKWIGRHAENVFASLTWWALVRLLN